MELSAYKDIKEKDKVFLENEVIDTEKDFDLWMRKMRGLISNRKLHMCFRGLSEAKYKNYSSLQRFWLGRDYDMNAQKMIERVQRVIDGRKNEEDKLSQYMRAINIHPNDWFILSFLQHYGAVSPLIDFSREVEVALFFACDGVKYPLPNDNIEKYMSVYYFKNVDASNHFPSILTTARKINADRKLKDEKLIDQLGFNKILNEESPILIISTYRGATEVHAKDDKNDILCRIPIANMYSIMQEGDLFVR